MRESQGSTPVPTVDTGLEVIDGRLRITHADVGGRPLLHHEGAPLIGPWFGRLPSPSASFAGRSFDVTSRPGQVDACGRPLHGFTSTPEDWVVHHSPGRAESTGSWFDPVAFPFPHQLRVEVTAVPGGIEVVTELTAHDTAVPVAFGWHPYLAATPHRTEARLGAELTLVDSLPDGTTTGRVGPALLDGPLDGYWTTADGDTVVTDGPAPVTLRLVSGWSHAVLWAPDGAPFTCAEPLAGPLDPFRGACRSIAPGAIHRAVFNITAVR